MQQLALVGLRERGRDERRDTLEKLNSLNQFAQEEMKEARSFLWEKLQKEMLDSQGNSEGKLSTAITAIPLLSKSISFIVLISTE